MIARVDSEEKVFTTTGCGCCSEDLNLEYSRDQILSELKWNVEVIKESCKVLDIDFLEFVCS